MKIDYFCFSVPTLGETDYVITPQDNENLEWIKTKELEQYEKAERADMLVVFDRSTKKFYKNGKEINLSGLNIFPKVFIPYEKELLTELERAGAIPALTLTERIKILEWPKYIQPKHRKAVLTTYGEFKENYKDYQEKFDHLFLKTAQKSNIHCFLTYYGEIEFGNQKYFVTKPPIFDLKDEDKIILSEEYYQIPEPENEMSTQEYRAFVLDGKILTMSRSYTDCSIPISDKIRNFAENFVAEISKTNFPQSYVIDIGFMKLGDKEVIDLIEFNSLCAAGLEIDNDIVGSYLAWEKENKFAV